MDGHVLADRMRDGKRIRKIIINKGFILITTKTVNARFFCKKRLVTSTSCTKYNAFIFDLVVLRTRSTG